MSFLSFQSRFLHSIGLPWRKKISRLYCSWNTPPLSRLIATDPILSTFQGMLISRIPCAPVMSGRSPTFLLKGCPPFSSFNPADIKNMHVYRTRYAQPVVVRNYSKVIPPFQTPIRNLYLSCMAQIYPEDRGQNHAVRMGREAALLLDGRPGESRPEFEELPSESCIEFEDRPGESCTKFEECPVEPCAKSGEHLCEQFTNAHAGKEERK